MTTSRNQKDYTLYEGSEDWSALYEDGELIEVGDHYWVQEKLLQLLGIEVIQSDDFIRGGDQREDVAQNLTAIAEWRRAKSVAEAQARMEKAAETLRQAEKDLAKAMAVEDQS